MTDSQKSERKICFAVMGFGKKTDFETGRTLDLDATYEALIAPAAEAEGLRCIRSDELTHAGMIDSEMYELLFRADLVIADISTGNVNAVYELGVRHALCPNSTIIMTEQDGRLHFDLNHTSTFRYQHLGTDIGQREVRRALPELRSLIRAALKPEKPDSPVYTFLPKLMRPQMSDAKYAEFLNEAEAAQEVMTAHLRAADEAQKASRHSEAVRELAAANALKPDDPYIVQQLALHTYKAEQPSKVEALRAALRIIEQLTPEHSNDPETLGITGAINKRLWLETSDRTRLDMAIQLYQRGFEIRRDYYNGENLAVCFEYRAGVQQDTDEQLFDRMSARKIRSAVIRLLEEQIGLPTLEDRSDRRWMFATLANCHLALGSDEEAQKHEATFLSLRPADWEIGTYEQNKAAVKAMQSRG